eukprot:6172461-Pleurochrysis_carterae.AAC.2
MVPSTCCEGLGSRCWRPSPYARGGLAWTKGRTRRLAGPCDYTSETPYVREGKWCRGRPSPARRDAAASPALAEACRARAS